MLKRFAAFAALMFLLSAALSAAAGAEAAQPATPTDLSCAHEHIGTTIYFFDSPAYDCVDAATHRVSGPADVETVCLDCGEVLSFEMVDYIEEIRPHSMKNGTCALCGFSQAFRTGQEGNGPASPVGNGEWTAYTHRDMNVGDLEFLTLSNEELAGIRESGASVLLIRGNSGSVSVAVEMSEIPERTETSGADLYLELAEWEDSSIFAGLYLLSAAGERRELMGSGIALRLYQESQPAIRVSVAPVDSEQMKEARAEWNDRGYWNIQYLGAGTYFILQ